jgi:hypothetical protein
MKISLNLKYKIHKASLKAESWKIQKNINKKLIVNMLKIKSMRIKT